jgi:hypothetical protein
MVAHAFRIFEACGADLQDGGARPPVLRGINRSGLLSAAALMREGMSATDAIKTVRSRRLGALNNHGYERSGRPASDPLTGTRPPRRAPNETVRPSSSADERELVPNDVRGRV